MSGPLPISLCIITRDAGAQLRDCIASVPFAAEIVVVDSGSLDDTVEIARACGARVIAHEWQGFGAQKNFAVGEASHDWVLCLDADERLSPELAAAIGEAGAGIAAPAAPAAYAMARRNRFLGRWLAHGEGYPDWNVRLFDRRHAHWTDDPVHEHVVAEGSVARMRGDLLHASAESLDNYMAKQNHYTTLQAEAMHARGEHVGAMRLAGSPLVRFVRFYFLKLGCLDGVAGLVHIAVGCFNSFMKYAKLRALIQAGAAASEKRDSGRSGPRDSGTTGPEACRDPGRKTTRASEPRHNNRARHPMKALVTGCAGFIGMHVAERLLAAGAAVTGVDNFDPYYDVTLKEARNARLINRSGFVFEPIDLADPAAVRGLFAGDRFTHVVHVAAQPGVRYSLVNPEAYVRNNVTAFGHVLEGCRHVGIAHLVYASSSSVYGANHTLPFSEDQRVDHPVSLYAATKKANELMAHSYSHLYRMPTTGLRFFTVYGPWGRPDMSPMIFTKAILAGRPIEVFNHGRMRRDFTYVDDVAEGVVRVVERPPAEADAPYAIYNIGNHTSIDLDTFITTLEGALRKSALRHYAPMQAGDIAETYAAIDRLAALTGFAPSTPLADGLAHFVAWYRDYYDLPAA